MFAVRCETLPVIASNDMHRLLICTHISKLILRGGAMSPLRTARKTTFNDNNFNDKLVTFKYIYILGYLALSIS